MSGLKRLDAWLVDSKDDGTGSFVAVASTPALDHDGESLAVGCFRPLPESVPCHIDHVLSVENIVGRAKPAYEGDRLMLRGRFASTAKAQTVRHLIKEGMLDAVSVLFVDAVYKNIGGVRTVTKGTLKSVDFVSVGANSEARLVSARSLDDQLGFMALKGQLLMAQIEVDDALDCEVRREFRRALSDTQAFLEAFRRPGR